MDRIWITYWKADGEERRGEWWREKRRGWEMTDDESESVGGRDEWATRATERTIERENEVEIDERKTIYYITATNKTLYSTQNRSWQGFTSTRTQKQWKLLLVHISNAKYRILPIHQWTRIQGNQIHPAPEIRSHSINLTKENWPTLHKITPDTDNRMLLSS